jgi:hypothetical protein
MWKTEGQFSYYGGREKCALRITNWKQSHPADHLRRLTGKAASPFLLSV